MIALAMYSMPLEDLRELRRHLRHLWVHHPVNSPEVYGPIYGAYASTIRVIGERYLMT